MSGRGRDRRAAMRAGRHSAPAGGSGDRDLAVEALLTEYESLRQESMEAIGHRMAATNFTFAALTVIVAALLSSDLPYGMLGAVLVLLVPQLAKAGLLIWLGEYQRSQRAGRFVAEVEERINELVGLPEHRIRWESRLCTAAAGTNPDVHMGYPYRAVVVLLLGTGYAAEALGVFFLLRGIVLDLSASTAVAIATGAGLALVLLLAELLFLRRFWTHWRAAKGGL